MDKKSIVDIKQSDKLFVYSPLSTIHVVLVRNLLFKYRLKYDYLIEIFSPFDTSLKAFMFCLIPSPDIT